MRKSFLILLMALCFGFGGASLHGGGVGPGRGGGGASRPATAPDPWRDIEPLPVSLSINDGDLALLSTQLNSALGMTAFAANAPVGRAAQQSKRYSLEEKNIPFWQLVLKLWEQQPFNIARSNPMRLTVRTGPVPPAAVSGPFLLTLNSQLFSKTTLLTDPPSQYATVQLNFELLGDPRLKNVEVAPFRLIEATDDAGNTWTPSVGPRFVPGPAFPGINSWSRMSEITLPKAPGTKLTTIKIEADISLDDRTGKKTKVTCQFVIKDVALP